MTDAEPSKKKRRFSREPDLEVVVEDEVFRVHSRDLMSASDVFATMLENDMRESKEARIVLAGKTKEEFRTLLKYICNEHGEAPADVKKEHVEQLLKWGDEYQISGLVSRCEKFLTQEIRKACYGGHQRDMVVARLSLAIEFELADLQKAAASHIANRVYEYRNDVMQFADHPSIMQTVLPMMFKEAGLEPPAEMPTGSLELKDVWPLVVRGLEAMKGKRKFEECQKHASKSRDVNEAEDMRLLRAAMRPQQLRPW